MAARSFGRDYYERFYRDPATRVASEASFDRVGRFVAAYLGYLEVNVDSVLDLGCGLGYWRDVTERYFPDASYTGVEISQYLCREYGWEHGSVVDWEGPAGDLVVCHGVLQYLSAREAKRAIRNLGRLTRGALYVEALTQEDWDHNVDQRTTDGDCHLRPAAWYRRELGRHFVSCGGGVFVPHDTHVVLFELEKMP